MQKFVYMKESHCMPCDKEFIEKAMAKSHKRINWSPGHRKNTREIIVGYLDFQSMIVRIEGLLQKTVTI